MSNQSNAVCKMAGHIFSIMNISAETHAFLKDYLSDRNENSAEFALAVTDEDIDLERSATEENLSRTDLECLAVHRKICNAFIDRDVLLMHGSCIRCRGKGYIFIALSGTGKSTHTNLWVKNCGAEWINDDKPFLHAGEEGITAFGSPWNGKHCRGINSYVPVSSIVILERAPKNSIERISAEDAMYNLYMQTYRPFGHELQYLKLIQRIADQVSFYRLRCNMEDEAAKVAFDGMNTCMRARMHEK